MKKAIKSEVESSVKSNGLSPLIDLLISQQDQINNLEKMIQVSAAKIERLSNLQYAIGALSLECDSVLAQEISVNAKAALNRSDSFHKQETDRRGEAFAWTGPDETFRFILYLSREKETDLSLNIMNFSLSKGASIEPWIDGYPVDWSAQNKASIFTEHRLSLPPQTGRKTPTLAEFKVSEMRRPSEENPESHDNRLLGVAFHSLEVR